MSTTMLHRGIEAPVMHLERFCEHCLIDIVTVE